MVVLVEKGGGGGGSGSGGGGGGGQGQEEEEGTDVVWWGCGMVQAWQL